MPTGGNVFNRKIIEAIDRLGKARVQASRVRVDRSLEDQVPDLRRFDALVVDSLLVDDRTLTGSASCRPWLLVHYLHMCDPTSHHMAKRHEERKHLPSFGGYLATSHYTRNCLVKAGVSPAYIEVVYPGLDERFTEPAPPLVQSVDTCRLLTVANILPGKGLIEFVDVLEELQHRAWTWEIVGDGGLDPACTAAFMERLEGSPVSDRVFWEGRREEEDMAQLYEEFDLFVMPSRFETLGMAVREAMACGLPVVAYDVGGIAESLGTKGGRLVPPYDRQKMVDVLEGLITSPADRHELGEEGRHRSMQFPSWTQSAMVLLEALALRV